MHFSPGFGKALCILIIQWTFLQSVMLIIRPSEIFHSIRIYLTARCNEENRVLYQRRVVPYDIGKRYAELTAQAIATLVGYFSYPPIVVFSVLCMGIRYIVDVYNVCYIFPPTSTGPEIHRYPVYLAMWISPSMCVLLFFYTFAYHQYVTEDTPFWEYIVAQ